MFPSAVPPTPGVGRTAGCNTPRVASVGMDVSSAVAHTPNSAGEWHWLLDHLLGVGKEAAHFGGLCGLAEPAQWGGRWHDIGKAADDVQGYLRACAIDPQRGRAKWAPHKMAGAVLAWELGLAPIALAIAGHHGGLPNLAGLKSSMSVERIAEHNRQGISAAAGEADLVCTAPSKLKEVLSPRGTGAGAMRELELTTRVLFSCLVDADFLDTEAHFDPDRAGLRQSSSLGMIALQERLHAATPSLLAARSEDVVADRRRQLLNSVLERSTLPPGLFTLTAPTGSGKTVMALSFALDHARRHGLKRIVMAAPYVSITEQTADVYRSLLDDGDAVVLEHHSGIRGSRDSMVARLAAENWDAEVVVTTTVQLLESLFSNLPSRCRKLHRLTRSVIIIDEAQSIPFGLLDPTLDLLNTLVARFGATVIMTTATQPPFDRLRSMRGVDITELVDDPAEWSARFARVALDYRPEPLVLADVPEIAAAEARQHDGQALVVLNTIDDASAVARSLTGLDGLVYLSTRLCPLHRRRVLADVRERLRTGRSCLLVATQVVEAGVDVSFPVAIRAMGPAIALTQVAGRVNRHGELGTGRLVVVDPSDGGCPPGDYAVGRDISRHLLHDGIDVLSEPGVREYYDRLSANMNDRFDSKGIQIERELLAYEKVAAQYRLIEKDMVSVLVDYRDALDVLGRARALPGRAAMRLLQPYLVSMRAPMAKQMREAGLIVPIRDFTLVERWVGSYSDVFGLEATAPSEEW